MASSNSGLISLNINLSKIWQHLLKGTSVYTQDKRDTKDKPSNSRTESWSGLRKYKTFPYFLLSDFYPLVKKHLNHPRKLPLSDISPV
jgi:hypothetical protein